MKTLASIFAIVSCLSAFASDYVGTGNADDINGWESPCMSVTVALAESESAVDINSIHFACGAISNSHPAIHLTKNQGDLFSGDKKVGSYSAQEIDAMLPSENIADVFFIVRILKKSRMITYREDWLSLEDGSFNQTFEMRGDLAQTEH